MSRKKKNDGLVSKVMKIPHKLIINDDGMRYLPWCDYFPHFGIVKDEDVCIARQCKHYRKLYIK